MEISQKQVITCLTTGGYGVHWTPIFRWCLLLSGQAFHGWLLKCNWKEGDLFEIVCLPNSYLLTNSNLCTQAGNYSGKQTFSHMVVGFVSEANAHSFSSLQKYLSLYNLVINYYYYICFLFLLVVRRDQGLAVLKFVCTQPVPLL